MTPAETEPENTTPIPGSLISIMRTAVRIQGQAWSAAYRQYEADLKAANEACGARAGAIPDDEWLADPQHNVRATELLHAERQQAALKFARAAWAAAQEHMLAIEDAVRGGAGVSVTDVAP